MNIDERVVAGIVNAVLDRLEGDSSPCTETSGGNWGILDRKSVV